MHSLVLVPNIYLMKGGVAKWGIPPGQIGMILKADIAAKNPSTANQADPAASMVVPMELGTRGSYAGGREDSATGPVEPLSSHDDGIGAAYHAYQSLLILRSWILVQRMVPLELVEWREPQGSVQEHDLNAASLK